MWVQNGILRFMKKKYKKNKPIFYINLPRKRSAQKEKVSPFLLRIYERKREGVERGGGNPQPRYPHATLLYTRETESTGSLPTFAWIYTSFTVHTSPSSRSYIPRNPGPHTHTLSPYILHSRREKLLWRTNSTAFCPTTWVYRTSG